ncbi:MAG TPA: GNAT family N-acetyltransferase [Planctomycetota bacterium]|nr:GNAT family N-acetyltransferase [Planctomycetota bacterium]
MGPDVRLYSAETIDTLAWPSDAESDRLRRYLVPMMKEGPRRFIDNVDCWMRALAVDDQVIPVVLSDPVQENTFVASPYSHYIAYAREELGKVVSPVVSLLRRGLSLIGAVARACSLDRVVYVNNRLWVTNPCVRLSREQVAAITDLLTGMFPDRAVVFRNVDEPTRGRLLDALKASGYGLIASRKIYLYDGSLPTARRHRDIGHDLRLLRRTPYAMVGVDDLADADFARIAEIYGMLYTDKYSRYNPQFNERFFRLVGRDRIMGMMAFRRDGRIDAFASHYEQAGILNPPAIGYDTTLPQKLGLYRLAFLMILREAMQRRMTVNLSAGVGRFKMLRGAVPTVEFDAVYDRHLDPHRRLPWTLLRLAFNRVTVEHFHV